MQRFQLLTNYEMYVDIFVQWAKGKVGAEGGYTEFIEPEGLASGSSRKRPQMPAYHLKRADGNGITLINIGVGASNAHTVCRCLAPLRPHALLMVGHCGGMRPTQSIGGFVVAEGYFRRDGVLDRKLPCDVPIPPIAEINTAFRDAVIEVCGSEGDEHKLCFDRGTVATVSDRFWEEDEDWDEKLLEEMLQANPAAVDMESGTVAACGYLWEIPYGTLLRISDMPLHGKIKLPGAAREFYQTRTDGHLLVAINAVEKLRKDPRALHSRKLRSVYAPAFR
jgi:AMP nucleosidase